MHTRCCSELLYWSDISIPTLTRWSMNFDGIDDVPVLIEVMFSIDSPVVGDILLANRIFTGSDFKVGNIRTGITAADMNLANANSVSPGFVIEYPQGIGRGMVMINSTDQLVENCFISIRKMVDITEALEKTQGSRYG